MLKAIKTDRGLDIPYDNKNSGQALSQLSPAEKRSVNGLRIFTY